MGAVADLFAIHLVRSPSFRDFRGGPGGLPPGRRERARGRTPVSVVFERHVGRPPVAGELLDTAQTQLDRYLEEPSLLAESMARQHNQIAERLSRFHLQVVEIAVGLPGLVLADTPIVHADLGSGRYGFRDRLALLEASLIIGPLTRSVAACFSARRAAPRHAPDPQGSRRPQRPVHPRSNLGGGLPPRRRPATPAGRRAARSPTAVPFPRTPPALTPVARRARIPAGRVGVRSRAACWLCPPCAGSGGWPGWLSRVRW